MRVTLDWLGVATFRLTVDERVIFLDAYSRYGVRGGVPDSPLTPRPPASDRAKFC